jgi:ankyrin repeat protein
MQYDVNRCNLLFSTGDLKGLKEYLPVLNRHKSWVGSGGLSSLLLAAWHNQEEMCKVLLEEGITPSVTEPFTGKTPLHFAAYLGHVEIAKTLKEFGADLLAQDFLCCSPIHYGAMGKHRDMITFFLRNKVKTSIQSNFGNVLDILIRKKSVELVDFFSNVNGVESLDIAYFWDCTPSRSIDYEEWTPFHSAAVSGQVEIFNMLMEKFPFVPEVTKPKLYVDLESAVSSLDLALLEGHTSISKMLGFKKDVKKYRKS